MMLTLLHYNEDSFKKLKAHYPMSVDAEKINLPLALFSATPLA